MVDSFPTLDNRGRTEFVSQCHPEIIGARAIAEGADLDGVYVSSENISRRSNDFESYFGCAGSDHIDPARRRAREIDNSSVDERTAIGDPHGDHAAVREVLHLHPRFEWKRPMCRRHRLHVIYLSVRRSAAVIRITVPTRNAKLDITDLWRSRCLYALLLGATGEKKRTQ
jgi:hypothetical protein